MLIDAQRIRLTFSAETGRPPTGRPFFLPRYFPELALESRLTLRASRRRLAVVLTTGSLDRLVRPGELREPFVLSREQTKVIPSL